MRLQSRYQYKTAKLKIKLLDNAIKQKGYELKIIRLSVTENRFEDKEYTIVDNGTCTVIIDIPGNDLQAFQGETDNNDMYNGGVSVYSFIPIHAWTTSDCLLNKDDILIYKILRYPMSNSDQTYQIQALQVAGVGARASNTILFNTYTLAPFTFNKEEYPKIEKILTDYQAESLDLGY